MKLKAHVQRRQLNEHAILDELAKLMPPGQPLTGASYSAIAQQIGQTPNTMLTAKRTLQRAGVLRVTITNPPGQRGRLSTWELTMPVEKAHEALSREHEVEVSRPSASKSATRQAERIVEAARRYHDRIQRGLAVHPDPALEAIIEVLPMIDALEGERDRLAAQVEQQRRSIDRTR